MKHKKRALFQSVVALLLCLSMFVGTTFSWFTDSVSSGSNIIAAGNLDIQMQYTDDLTNDESWKDASEGAIFNYQNWEPGYTDLKYLKIENLGNLAFQYQLNILPADPVAGGESGDIDAGSIDGSDPGTGETPAESASADAAAPADSGSIDGGTMEGGTGTDITVDGGDIDAPLTGAAKLAEVIDVYYGVVDSKFATREEAMSGLAKIGTLSQLMNQGVAQGILLPAEGKASSNVELPAGVTAPSGETKACIMLKMQETTGNEYMGIEVTNGFRVELKATQYTYELDAFGNTYDTDAAEGYLTGVFSNLNASGTVEVGEDGKTTVETKIGGATIPAGVAVTEGTTELTLTVSQKAESEANVQLGENETSLALDVHIEGVAESNTVPMIIDLGTAAAPYLNQGNIALYHVEDGETTEMTRVDTREALDNHNEFYYDVATGNVTVALASFSEITLTATTNNEWNGQADYSWYTDKSSPYIICNADQLYALARIVGGMDGNTQYSFTGDTINLIADINLADDEDNNVSDKIFYPIGYYLIDGSSGVKSFEGIFNGTGHTIKNFYQNTWEIKGDYDGTYYNDAMGLFGYIVNGTVKNLTVDHFASDGEFTPTGVIAAYAVNSTFENIAITNCNPRVYNTGNGGIIGIAGNSNDSGTQITLKNITVDNSNKISALWGSWDVACGGLVGMFRGNADGGTGKIHFENCHVAAQIDVYNDVCANYQYYAYRYAGMIIGSIRHNTTNADGKTIPNMTGITATGCTVNYGDWNDYYYCEFEKNSMASYSEDYQFSRVDKSEIIFDANGNVTGCTHEHTEAEDKRAVYLPFHQLFTGYSWGVSSIGLKEYSGIATNLDITEGEDNESVTKFEATATSSSYEMNQTVTIGELFTAIEGVSPAIDVDNVQVTVSPADDTSTAGGTYTANTTDWTQGTLTFSGLGTAEIIITDYYFCNSTSLTVTITEPVDVEKFTHSENFSGSFLYRVGNANTVALGSLFEAVEGQADNIGNVTVTVEALEGATVSGTYTANATDWTQGTIQFSGTGPVNVTIDDDAYAVAYSMELEVVNATNVTDYSGLGNRNSVLLNDITMSSGSSYYLSGATLYGNGFTFDMSDGTYAAGGNTSSNYVFGLNNATIDNTKVVGAVYTKYGATVQSEYNRAAVLTTGNCTITNSLVSNCASAVRIKDGTLEIVNSTIKGGNFANIDIRGGNVTLNNVTTINQVNGNDTAEDGTVVVGLGVVIYYENVLSTTTLDVTGTFTQYNHLSESQAETYITDSTASTLVSEMFKDTYSSLQYTKDNEKWINTGIISMIDTVGDANISDIEGYTGMSASVTQLGMTVNGYVYTETPNDTSIDADSTETDSAQGAIPPEYSFDYTTKNYQAKVDGSNDYCYEENGTVYISMDEGDTFNWDTSILTVTKNGQTLDYTVSMDGTDYTGKSIAFNTAGNYVVEYTYTDGNNYARISTYDEIYTQTVNISVAVIEASAKSAEFTMGSSNAATEKITVDNVTYVSAAGVTADNSTWSYMTVGDQKIYYPIVAAKLTSTKGSSSYAYFPVFENVISITDYADNGTGDAFTYNSSTTTPPSTLTAVKGVYKAASDVTSWSNLTNSNLTQSGASKIFKWASGSDAPSDPETYNNVLCYKSPQISADRVAYITLVQYSYTDATNTTYYYYVGYTLEAFTKQTTCVTPDTLITLADGTQKRIDETTYEDQFLVWDFVKGEYTTAPASIVMNHGSDKYTVVALNFSDGTTVKTINGHGFYHEGTNKFVILSEANAADYVGHSFTKQGGTSVKLVSYDVREEYTESWSVLTAEYYNCILEGMLTITPAEVEGSPDYLMPFTVGEGMKYDAEAMQADIETYGLYTYEEFSDYMTYEQFTALNLPIFKVAVGKGYITYEDILYLISIHIGN